MASDATAKQIENRKNVIFWTAVVFLVLVIIGIIGAIIKTVTPRKETEADVAAELVEQGNAERKSFPIVEYLPIKNSLFTLGYQFSDQGQKLTLKVNTTATYLDDAINKLKSFNVDLTNCALDVTAPENPFLSAYVVNSASDPTAALETAYSRVADFQVAKVVEVDEYIVAKITSGLSEHYNLQTYLVILKKNDNDNWTPVANPAPILNLYNTPGVSIDLLRQANQL